MILHSSLPTLFHPISPTCASLAAMSFIQQLFENILTFGHPDMKWVCPTTAQPRAGPLPLNCKRLGFLCSKAMKEGCGHEGKDKSPLKVPGPSPP